MSGKLVVIHPSGMVTEHPYEKSGAPDWVALKGLVGGYIERVRVRYEGKVRDAYVNENGISEGLPLNPHGAAILAAPFTPGTEIVGPLVVWVPNPKVKK